MGILKKKCFIYIITKTGRKYALYFQRDLNGNKLNLNKLYLYNTFIHISKAKKAQLILKNNAFNSDSFKTQFI